MVSPRPSAVRTCVQEEKDQSIDASLRKAQEQRVEAAKAKETHDAEVQSTEAAIGLATTSPPLRRCGTLRRAPSLNNKV